MRIVIVAQNYYPFVGGVETHARQVVKELTRRGHQVSVVAANFAPNRLSPRLSILHETLLTPPHADFDDEGVPVHALAPTSTADRVKMLPVAVRALPKVQRFAYHGLRRFAYRPFRSVYRARLRKLIAGADMVHSLAHGYIGWIAEQVARESGIPFAVTPFVHPHQWGDSADDVAFYKRSDAVIGLVPTDTAYLAEIGVPESKLHTIGVSPELPATVDPDGFRTRHGLTGTPFVLYVGRMMAQKGSRAVVEAAPAVWERFPDTRFIFVGPANESEAAIFSGVDKRITYLGKVSGAEKADALAACDIFCMPSMSEILPTVYLEAWSLGRPVVGGRAHGLPELVEGSGGGIAAAQDGAAISDALCRLLADPVLRQNMGAAGQALVERKYTVAAVTNQLENLYTDLAAQAKPGGKG